MASPSDMSQEGSAKKTTFDELTKEELITKCKNLLVIAQKAKQAKTDYHNEAENQKVRYEKCESEKKVLEDNFKTLQELVDSLTEQKLTFITEIDTANNKVRQLTGKCQEYEEELGKYKAELLLKDKAILESKQKLSDFDSEIISLKRQNNRLLEENEQLITQLSELEAKVAEFNSIGLQQHEQLQTLEETISNDTNQYKIEIEDLHSTILKLQAHINTENSSKNYDDKINELTQLYENEVGKNEKANIKLKCYRDKILKCASCISQLKNSRFILAKTVKEYSENIPKWQNDIINASKVLERQLNELNEENISLKEVIVKLNSDISNMKGIELNEKRLNELNLKATTLESELHNVRKENEILLANYNASKEENCILKQNYTEFSEVKLPTLTNENVALNSKVAELKSKIDTLTSENGELILTVSDLTSKNKTIQGIINSKVQNNDIENLNLQLKALESEKAILVREKLTARDSIVELENQNKLLNNQIDQMKNNIQQMKAQLEQISQDQINNMKDRDDKVNSLRSQEKSFQDQYNILKKEYEGLQDLNTLLKEEVETLKLSLEQPADDSENMSESNMSMQADFVKLETKLSNYKQENASLLAEMKESRAKIKEAENILSEFEEAKSKLASYKSENNELLTEMKEINQVLKERGEAISKLQKAVSESERLIETLEKERENSMSEKEDLLKKYRALENEHKSAEQKASDSNKINNQIIAEKDDALKCLKEKEAIIVSLNEEIEKLKQQQSSVAELPNDDNMSTSTISRADDQNRMKDLDDTFEDKYTKLRIFALKLKKKLNDTVIQLENAEKDKAKLEKTINEAPAASVDQVDSHQSTQRESKITDLEEKVKMLTANVSQSEELTDELEKLKAELSSKSQQLAAEIEAHKVTRDNLDKAKREVKKKSVLSLEMEDYERSMKELTSKMEENKKKIVQMESTIDTQEGTIVAMKTQIKLLEEQIKSEETQSRLLKEELRRILDESKEKDMEINSKNDTISKLEQDIEVEKRRNEEADLELTSVIGEKEKIIMKLGEEKTELNSKLKRVEFKCAELNEKLRIANIELDDLKAEYTSYKVRAQSVLRQNQTVDHSQEEQIKEELAALKAQMDTVVAKLNSATEQNDDLKSELSSCARRAAESAGEVSRAQQRTARLQSDLTRLSQQLDSERTQHKLQISTLTQCYKAQIVDLEAKVQEVDTLKSQLATLKESQSKASVVEDANRNPAPYMLPVIPKEDGSDGEMDINVSMIPREDGEGSEFAPSPPLSKSFMSGGNARRSPMPLERLLEEGVPDDEAMDVSSLGLTPEQEIADLRRKLLAQVQRVKHVTVLLSESERECARMSQLSELLKSELRRARGTSQTTHNTEYMKNVTFKFLTLPPGDERSRLVPVLQKILTLTPEETNKIHAVAKGQDPNSGRGWGSYLPWPGGKST